MKRLSFAMAVMGLFIFANPVSASLSFTDTKTWNSPYEFNDSFIYTHSLSLSPLAANLDSASLSIKYSRANTGEQWSVVSLYAAPELKIGDLQIRSNQGFSIQQFTLSNYILKQIQDAGWKLTIELREGTPGADNLKISESVFSGTYSPVPVPPAVWLLGSGLIGLIAIRRRYKH
jgi:hypothetical protein